MYALLLRSYTVVSRKRLGKGVSGTVFEARRAGTGSRVAVKAIRINVSSKRLTNVWGEMDTLLNLRKQETHRNVVQLFDIIVCFHSFISNCTNHSIHKK